MSDVVPSSRPQLSIVDARKLLAAHGVTESVVILAQRGYYRDSLGAKGKNDRGIFDDMIAVLSPRVFRTFNGNTDPSATRHRDALAVASARRLGVQARHPPPRHAERLSLPRSSRSR
jgi:hypothetical protein